jgi:hypothetical protein
VHIRLAPRVLLAATMAVAMPLPVSAQAPAAQKSAPSKPAAPAAAAAPQTAQPARVPVPPAETLVLLIRMSLLTLNDALQTGNYTVLRDRGSPAFREANSAAKLARIFSQLEGKGIDLALVTIRAPQLTEAAVTDPGQRLRVKGFFPGQPTQLEFDLAYEPVNGHWQLFGISVAEAPATAQAAAPQKAAPAQKPAAAKK